jgi:hypothetical protein
MYYTEKKFIIVKQYNRVKHFIFPKNLWHDTFARDNGFYYNDILETGLIRIFNGKACVLVIECRVKEHKSRAERKGLFSDDLRARECQSLYAYKLPAYLRQGD